MALPMADLPRAKATWDGGVVPADISEGSAVAASEQVFRAGLKGVRTWHEKREGIG